MSKLFLTIPGQKYGFFGQQANYIVLRTGAAHLFADFRGTDEPIALILTALSRVLV